MIVINSRGRKKPENKESPKRNKQGNWPFPAHPPASSSPTEDEEVIRKAAQGVEIDEQTDDNPGIGSSMRWNRSICWFEVFDGRNWKPAIGDPDVLLSKFYRQSSCSF